MSRIRRGEGQCRLNWRDHSLNTPPNRRFERARLTCPKDCDLALRPTDPRNRTSRLANVGNVQQDVFVREVDDAVREEKFHEAIRKYARPVGAAVVAGLAALAGFLWYDGHRATVREGHAEAFTQALDQVEAGQLDAARAKLAGLSDSGAGYQAASKMLAAGIAAQQGKADEAAKGFEAIAADTNAPQPYRDLANVRLVALRFDAMKPDEVITRLKALATPGNAFFPSAGELVGLAYMKQGHNDLAGPLFAAIAKQKDAPDSIRSRARQLAGLLGVDTVDDAKKMVQAASPAGAAEPDPQAQPAQPQPQPQPAPSAE